MGFLFFFFVSLIAVDIVFFVCLVMSPRERLRHAPASISGLVNHAIDMLEGRKPVKRVR